VGKGGEGLRYYCTRNVIESFRNVYRGGRINVKYYGSCTQFPETVYKNHILDEGHTVSVILFRFRVEYVFYGIFNPSRTVGHNGVTGGEKKVISLCQERHRRALWRLIGYIVLFLAIKSNAAISKTNCKIFISIFTKSKLNTRS